MQRRLWSTEILEGLRIQKDIWCKSNTGVDLSKMLAGKSKFWGENVVKTDKCIGCPQSLRLWRADRVSHRRRRRRRRKRRRRRTYFGERIVFLFHCTNIRLKREELRWWKGRMEGYRWLEWRSLFTAINKRILFHCIPYMIWGYPLRWLLIKDQDVGSHGRPPHMDRMHCDHRGSVIS